MPAERQHGNAHGPQRPRIAARLRRRWTEAERLAKEKEILGFYISGHPLERFRDEVELFATRTTVTLGEWGEQTDEPRRRRDRRQAADQQKDRQGVRPVDSGGFLTDLPRCSSFRRPGPS